MFKRILPLAAALCMAACTSMGNNSNLFDNNYLKSHLLPGKTTQNDVVKLFGEPENKAYLPEINTEIWDYTDRNDSSVANSVVSQAKSLLPGGTATSIATSGVRGSDTKHLSIKFSDAGMVKTYSLSN